MDKKGKYCTHLSKKERKIEKCEIRLSIMIHSFEKQFPSPFIFQYF